MIALLLWGFAVVPSVATPRAPAPTEKPVPPCERLASALWPQVLVEAPVEVVVEATAEAVLDPAFTIETIVKLDPPSGEGDASRGTAAARALGGEVPGTHLCALAASPGVVAVRAPWVVAPK